MSDVTTVIPDGLRAGPAIIANLVDGTVLARDSDGKLWSGKPKGVSLDALETVVIERDGCWEVWHHYDGWVQGAGRLDHHPDPDAAGSQASYVTTVTSDGQTVRVPKLKQVYDWEAL